MNRLVNQKLCEETIRLTQEIYLKYKTRIDKSISGTVKHSDVRDINYPIMDIKTNEPCVVEVVYDDSADAGYTLLQAGYNPMILNMASDRKAGGGWRNGAMAQEEALFYRSLYYLSLEKQEYPIPTYGAIYTPDVFFFRTNQLDGFTLLPYDQCCFLSCLAMPAIRNPQLKKDGTYRPTDRTKMKEKIRGIMKVALLHNHDSVVLGALGCGAFKNPPDEVAKIFEEVVNEYKSKFRKIVFAILDYGRSNNYSIFQRRFVKMIS